MFAWLVGPKREIRNLTLDLDVNISETVGESDFFLPDRILFCDFLYSTVWFYRSPSRWPKYSILRWFSQVYEEFDRYAGLEIA